MRKFLLGKQPAARLQEGLGTLEIKAETIRHKICVGSDLLQDAGFPIENWILQKAAQGFPNTINKALLIGDGVGKPLGDSQSPCGHPDLRYFARDVARVLQLARFDNA
jgi:HK97 family phage major capsid protein